MLKAWWGRNTFEAFPSSAKITKFDFFYGIIIFIILQFGLGMVVLKNK